MHTPLGLTQSVLIRGVALFQGLLNIREILLGLIAVSGLQWMSAFQGYISAKRGDVWPEVHLHD